MTKWGVKVLKICQNVYLNVSSVVYQHPHPPPPVIRDMTLLNSHICIKQYFVMCSV